MVKVTFAVVACALVAAAGASARPAARPALHVAAYKPLTIRGDGFVAGERVQVELLGVAPAVRRATASTAGAFTVRFAVSIGRCRRFTVFAFGSHRSRASLLPTRVQPDCVGND